MRRTASKYLVLLIVFVLSVVITLLLPLSEIARDIASFPAIGALIGALYQKFRDEALYEKERSLQRQQHIFNLGTTSHMANVSFDKHVEFCEKYMEEVHGTVSTLFREGPTTNALEHVSRLLELKKKYAAWISKDIAVKLEPFENALDNIGSLSHLKDALGNTDPDGRVKVVKKMYSVFRDVMHMQNCPVSESAAEDVKEKVRSILNIDALTKIRGALIDQALSSLNLEQPGKQI